MLYICSEETARPERIPDLPESLTLRGLCVAGDERELLRRLGQPTWVAMGHQLLTDPLIPDDDFDTLLSLFHHCRRLRRHFGGDDEDALWSRHHDDEHG